tara:strand:- start:150 stop:314 length:165 start_codon:yes stop_codon:yes gene_type:complete
MNIGWIFLISATQTYPKEDLWALRIKTAFNNSVLINLVEIVFFLDLVLNSETFV